MWKTQGPGRNQFWVLSAREILKLPATESPQGHQNVALQNDETNKRTGYILRAILQHGKIYIIYVYIWFGPEVEDDNLALPH